MTWNILLFRNREIDDIIRQWRPERSTRKNFYVNSVFTLQRRRWLAGDRRWLAGDSGKEVHAELSFMTPWKRGIRKSEGSMSYILCKLERRRFFCAFVSQQFSMQKVFEPWEFVILLAEVKCQYPITHWPFLVQYIFRAISPTPESFRLVISPFVHNPYQNNLVSIP